MIQNLTNALKLIALTPAMIDSLNKILESEISMPNIPTPTAGGKLLWDTLAEYEGWRLQQNEVTKHCRILDPDDVRRAWGTKSGMFKALETLQKSVQE